MMFSIGKRFFRILLVTDVGYHCLGILTDLHEVLV